MLGRFSPAVREQLQQAGGARGRRAALSTVSAAHDEQRECSDDRRAQDAHTEAQVTLRGLNFCPERKSPQSTNDR